MTTGRTDPTDAPASTTPVPPEVPRRDISPWGHAQVYDSVDELATAPLANGLVTVMTAAAPVDLLIEDNGAATTVVSLHAAIGQKPMDLPIFTGRSVTEWLPVNRVFISDATLCLGADLKLGWYLGGTDLDLTRLLREVLVTLQARFGARHLVLFGMSGGGFASLNISHSIPGSLAVPVNPQTRVADYYAPAYQAFAAAALGAHGPEAALAALEAHPRADQRAIYAAGFDNTVIYLQNSEDAHLRTQLEPWLQALPTRDRVHVLLRDWGRGHVPPTARELRALMERVSEVDGDWALLARRWGAVPAADLEI